MKAIALISGGLDSILAAKVIQNLGIEIIPLHFAIPFSHNTKKSSRPNIKELVLKNLRNELNEIVLGEEFLDLIKKPAHGLGSNMNPCIDCKILMLRKAKGLMSGWKAKFVITGEVLGQRPMSQNKNSLTIIEKDSGLEGFVLRPLSSRLLPPTVPEQEKWVEREKLLGISGRGRNLQMELAEKLGVEDYPQPAGGCLLTDPEFARRLRDLITHNELNLENIELLKIGRHFRISPATKLVVGRNENENHKLVELAKEKDYLFIPKNTPGPTALGRGKFNEELIRYSCEIVRRYCDGNNKNEIEIHYEERSPALREIRK
ncbi:MAG: tRNA 4-thiouridine(8) synthase ThiI [Candidatus Omnitrophica bacterium]|nr:tRNA 4-thiouridine(8) synthase ThiI [Candidatus Omnitrophota bacterium]